MPLDATEYRGPLPYVPHLTASTLHEWLRKLAEELRVVDRIENFKWNYNRILEIPGHDDLSQSPARALQYYQEHSCKTAGCALGYSLILFGQDITEGMLDLLSNRSRCGIFYGDAFNCSMSRVTPDMVADEIERQLEDGTIPDATL